MELAFVFPEYQAPDFTKASLAGAPGAKTARAEQDGVAPEGFHATSIFPEYIKVGGQWALAYPARMDGLIVLRADGTPEVRVQRELKAGDAVVLGRRDDGTEGIYLHTGGFPCDGEGADPFAFRTGRSRETAFSVDYDNLYELLEHEKRCGNIVWVAGPAVAFDADARGAMQRLIETGFVHGLLAGNALATHDLEAAMFETALGQNIYTQKAATNGHYHHLDLINRVCKSGSISQFISDYKITGGIMCGAEKAGIPYVLTGSIRDDGPLPGVVHSAYEGQAAMRHLLSGATTVICLATQLHTIAAGNMTPSFCVRDGKIRPVYFYTVDISEFVVNKLRDRGSLSAISMVTNVQDFVVHVAKCVCST